MRCLPACLTVCLTSTVIGGRRRGGGGGAAVPIESSVRMPRLREFANPTRRASAILLVESSDMYYDDDDEYDDSESHSLRNAELSVGRVSGRDRSSFEAGH